ncbi:MAG: AlpA family phage regulatory protein [Acidobacteria bacterium]|nr:AlpA family phage regulatory protein [Acidobacteriota bacterium]
MEQVILRQGEVTRVTGVPKGTIYRWIEKGTFPRPVRLGPRAVGWRRTDIEKWAAERQPRPAPD